MTSAGDNSGRQSQQRVQYIIQYCMVWYIPYFHGIAVKSQEAKSIQTDLISKAWSKEDSKLDQNNKKISTLGQYAKKNSTGAKIHRYIKLG
jgi:hypothetical protein